MYKKILAKVLRKFQNLFIGNSKALLAPSLSIIQKNLSLHYRHAFASGSPRILIEDTGFRVNSQHDEDGILLFIFALIGTSNKKCIEICCGDGIECNVANLVLHHRWNALMIDGDLKNIEVAKKFYSTHPDSKIWPPKLIQKWITKENINAIISENNFEGEIDLLSIDVDGVDYWLWKEISACSPRVVVLEINHLWGPVESVTIPYSPQFVAEYTQYGSDYAGASLQAFIKLARDKGYFFVGTNSICTNAFFVRNDIKCSWLSEKDPKDCFKHPRAIFGMNVRLPGVKDKTWIKV